LLNTEKDSEIEPLIPNFSNDIRILLTEFLGYYPTELECKNIDELEIEFPNQNNGLAGLEFKELDNLAKCIWDENSWYSFHFHFFKNNPNNRYFIEQRQRLQGDKFNMYFPNLDYSNKLAPHGWENFKQDLSKFPNEKNGKASEMAKKVAERNFYQHKQELSSYNQKIKGSLRQIFESVSEPKIYLSTDFEGGNAFEVCNYQGKHLGEFLFSGKQNKDADQSGNHDIILLK
jgi:hypothetical protein